VRRIEAVTGKEAELFIYASEDFAEKAAELLKAPVSKLIERTHAVLEENKLLSNELKQLKRASLKTISKELLAKAQKAGSHSFIGETVAVEADLLPELVEDLMISLRSGVIVLGTKIQDRCQLIARVSSDLTQKGIQAVQLIKEIAPSIGGSGGGKAESAQAGGKNPEGLKEALDKAKEWLSAKCC
jgi:alanyl-tRNA synthetase